MDNNLIAKASVDINAPLGKVWDALVNPDIIRQYMFGTRVESDWEEGSIIVWKGEWKGKQYEDKGTILKIEPENSLIYTHYSPLTGDPDKPEFYHRVSLRLSMEKGGVHVELKQDNNPTVQAREHAENNWNMMLGMLKEFLEN